MGFLVLLKVFAGFLYWFYIIGFTMGFRFPGFAQGFCWVFILVL